MTIENENTNGNRVDVFEDEINSLTKDVIRMPQRIDQGGLIFFKSEEDIRIAKTHTALIATQLKIRLEATEIVGKQVIEQLARWCEAQARVDGIQIGERSEKEISELRARRNAWVDKAVEEFIELFDAAQERLKKIIHPALKVKEEQRLERELESFFETIKHFDDEFERTLRFKAAG